MKFQTPLEHAAHLAKEGCNWAEITLQTGIRPTVDCPEITACNPPLEGYKHPLPYPIETIVGMFKNGNSIHIIVDKLWNRKDIFNQPFTYTRVKQIILVSKGIPIDIENPSRYINKYNTEIRKLANRYTKQIENYNLSVAKRLRSEQNKIAWLLKNAAKVKKSPTYKVLYKKEWVKKSQDIKIRNRERLLFREAVAKYHFQEQQQLRNLLFKLTPKTIPLQEKKTHNAHAKDLESRVMIYVCHLPQQSLSEVADHFSIPLPTIRLFIKAHLPQLKEWLNITPVTREKVISEYFIEKKRFEISKEEKQ